MNSTKFWEMLNDESKEMAKKILSNYNGSNGVIGRIFELYEEGANNAGLTIEEYLEDVDPNEYVKYYYDAFLDRMYMKNTN